MARIEGFRVRNYKALKDVTLGKLAAQKAGRVNALHDRIPHR